MKSLINVAKLVRCQQENTELWHQQPPSVSAEGWLAIMLENHLHNFELWHEEDKARRDDMGYEYVYQAKRNIDRHNQKRNNAIEALDAWIEEHYQPKVSGCPFNSETPGMMIDRLSILALKAYHMQLQTVRDDVDAAHIESCRQKFYVIEQQRDHLAESLQALLAEIVAGTRSFRVYHQFKMYNDPNLNPALYKHRSDAAA